MGESLFEWAKFIVRIRHVVPVNGINKLAKVPNFRVPSFVNKHLVKSDRKIASCLKFQIPIGFLKWNFKKLTMLS